MELIKSQKKIACKLIYEVLQRECKTFMRDIEQFVRHTNRDEKSPHEMYLSLYKKVHSFDKHLGRQYHNLGGSQYFIAVYSLFCNNVLMLEDINQFDEEVQQQIIGLKNSLNSSR